MTPRFALTFAAGRALGAIGMQAQLKNLPGQPAVVADSPASSTATSADHAGVPDKPVRLVARRSPKAAEAAPAAAAAALPNVRVSDPELHSRVKRLLRPGADMGIASEGFKNAEDLAAVAHAAQNVNIPFMLLKHRIVDEGQTLATALGELRPDINAVVEAERARAEARSDLASLN
jgi:hypothetical protein